MQARPRRSDTLREDKLCECILRLNVQVGGWSLRVQRLHGQPGVVGGVGVVGVVSVMGAVGAVGVVGVVWGGGMLMRMRHPCPSLTRVQR